MPDNIEEGGKIGLIPLDLSRTLRKGLISKYFPPSLSSIPPNCTSDDDLSLPCKRIPFSSHDFFPLPGIFSACFFATQISYTELQIRCRQRRIFFRYCISLLTRSSWLKLTLEFWRSVLDFFEVRSREKFVLLHKTPSHSIIKKENM